MFGHVAGLNDLHVPDRRCFPLSNSHVSSLSREISGLLGSGTLEDWRAGNLVRLGNGVGVDGDLDTCC